MNMKYDIIPIGKYKGQPIEQLMADQPYSEWLLAQAWFIDRYADLAQLLKMGRMTEPQDTPDHNAMVAGLLDQRNGMESLAAEIFEDCFSNDLTTLYRSTMFQEVEPKGADIRVGFGGVQIMIEVKPLIGDDFPSVIRQVKVGMSDKHTQSIRAAVIARHVQATNLTVAQVRRQFELAGVFLMLEDEFFESGQEWSEKRYADIKQATCALEERISDLRSQLESAKANSKSDVDDWSASWDDKRHISTITKGIASAGDELAILLAI